MSETSGGPSSTPAGWYPTGDGYERWWDGNAWSQHHVRPAAPPAAPAPTYAQPQPGYAQQGYPPQQPYYVAPPSSGGGGALKVVLIVVGVVLVLLVGGCVALVTVAGTAIDSAVEDMEAEDSEPGGPDNPLEITVGEAFDVRGFAYGAGWTIGVDSVDDLDVQGLSVTNNRDGVEQAIVDITLLRGGQVLAETSCASSLMQPGQTSEVSCLSTDPLPTDYDTVTIRDTL